MPFETEEWAEDIATTYLNDAEFEELLGRVRRGNDDALLRAIVELRHSRLIASELLSLVQANESRANDRGIGLLRALVHRERPRVKCACSGLAPLRCARR